MSNFITGPAGSGKTTELLRRIAESSASNAVLVTAGAASSLAHLRELCSDPQAHVLSFDEIALKILGENARIIDDAEAALLFEEAAEPLLSLEWTEFVEAQLDPEVPGMRAPHRFLDAAFRLFFKLRDNGIGPDEFLESALRGATSFYGKPPNLAHPGLLAYTKDAYHDSLNADGTELQRQYRCEVDLAKILAKLYRSYLEHLVKRGCLTARDAVAEATFALEAHPESGLSFRAEYPAAFVDDVQELTLMELRLLQALYGQKLENVTMAGDRESAVSTFRGARPDRVFALATQAHACEEQHRSPYTIDAACRRLSGTEQSKSISTDPEIGLSLFRGATKRAEAEFVAEHVADLLRDGATPQQIALIFRSVRNVGIYRDALLERNIFLEVSGDVSIFEEPDALDALALLWLVHDPFRHDYLLRVLSGRAMALSDASLATLCSDPGEGQTLLFEELAADEADVRTSRWDPKRDFRLGWNVVRGDRDADLSSFARERVMDLRQKLSRWVAALRTQSPPQLAAIVWNEGLARVGEPASARAEYQQLVLRRLHRRIGEFSNSNPSASLAEFLEYAQSRAGSDFESCESSPGGRYVRLLNIEASRGLEFDHVVLPNVRAGAFPRWYAPDAFLYSPSLGMIAKENVGDARTMRTAKFTYYMFASKAREAYNKEERRACVYALRRAKRSALVTAHERATRGIAAPEFLFELQSGKLPGAIDRSGRQPSQRSLYAG